MRVPPGKPGKTEPGAEQRSCRPLHVSPAEVVGQELAGLLVIEIAQLSVYQHGEAVPPAAVRPEVPDGFDPEDPAVLPDDRLRLQVAGGVKIRVDPHKDSLRLHLHLVPAVSLPLRFSAFFRVLYGMPQSSAGRNTVRFLSSAGAFPRAVVSVMLSSSFRFWAQEYRPTAGQAGASDV